MKAVILAAGRGSRMGTLTDSSPKCLVRLAGKPLLSYQIEALQQAGVQEIGVVTGYAKEKISDLRVARTFENTRWQTTNMVRSLMEAESWLAQDTCVISYSDIFYTPSAVTSLIHTTADIAITYDANFETLWSARFEDPLADLEAFRMDTRGMLSEIGGRATSLSEIQGQYMGLLKFTPAGWTTIKQSLQELTSDTIDTLDMTSLLRQLLSLHVSIHAVRYEGVWGEVDQESDLTLYEQWHPADAILP